MDLVRTTGTVTIELSVCNRLRDCRGSNGGGVSLLLRHMLAPPGGFFLGGSGGSVELMSAFFRLSHDSTGVLSKSKSTVFPFPDFGLDDAVLRTGRLRVST